MSSVPTVPHQYSLHIVKPPAVAATTRTFDAQPYNGTSFAPNQSIMIPLPTGRPGSFFDPHMSYLQFQVDATFSVPNGTATSEVVGAYTDNTLAKCGAMAFIQEMRILVNGVVIEEIQNYNLLCELLHDFHAGGGTYGMDGLMYNGAQPAVQRSNGYVIGTANGHSIFHTLVNATGATVTTAFSFINCIPLVSGILGTMAEKAWPAMLLSPGSMILELKLAPTIVPFRSNVAAITVTNWAISKVKWVGKEVIVADDVSATILQAAQSGALSIHCQTYRDYQCQLQNSKSLSQILPIKLLSLNSLFFCFRDVLAISSNTFSALTRLQPGETPTFVNNYKTIPANNSLYFQLMVGSERLPARPLSDISEFVVELKKSLGRLVVSDVPWSPNLDTSYRVTGNRGNEGSFVIGLDMDTFSMSNSSVRSGRNTTGDQITLELRAETQNDLFNDGAIIASVLLDTIALHDMKLSFMPGGLITAIW